MYNILGTHRQLISPDTSDICPIRLFTKHAQIHYASYNHHDPSSKFDPIPLPTARKRNPEELASSQGRTDFRSTMGSLRWPSPQSRPDISFKANLKVLELARANALGKEIRANVQVAFIFCNLGRDSEVVVFHDAALFL